MSDRARSSVRTEARGGSGTSDGVPEAAGPGRAGATAVGAESKAPAAGPGRSEQSAKQAPQDASQQSAKRASQERPQESAKRASQERPQESAKRAPQDAPQQSAKRASQEPPQQLAKQTALKAPPEAGQQARPAEPSASVDGTQVITPDSPPSGVFAAAARPSGQTATPAGTSAPPLSPLVPPPGAPPAQGGGRPGGSRSQAPAAPAGASAGIDSTQAVPLAAAGSRPAAAPGRPSAGTAAGAGAAAAGAGAAAKATTGKERARGAGRGPRRARLQLRHIDTWSALKISLVVSIALFFVWMVAVAVLYGVLGGLGVFNTLNDLIGQLSTASGSSGGGDVITAGVVFWSAAVIGAVNIVLLTALCTVAAFVYNLCSDLVGGLEVTLAERD